MAIKDFLQLDGHSLSCRHGACFYDLAFSFIDGCHENIVNKNCFSPQKFVKILRMASNFSANQYEKEFKSRSLCNWEVPHWYPKHPRRRTETTGFIANDRGHLLPSVERPKSSPWGRFQTTWQLPPVITREMANEINAPPIGSSRWTIPDPNRKVLKKPQDLLVEVKKEKEEEKSEVEKPAEREVADETPAAAASEKQQEAATKVFNEKEKLNSPLAIARQGRRAIRHETLERDNDEH